MCGKCRIDLPTERWRNFLRNVDHSQEDQIKGQKFRDLLQPFCTLGIHVRGVQNCDFPFQDFPVLWASRGTTEQRDMPPRPLFFPPHTRSQMSRAVILGLRHQLLSAGRGAPMWLFLSSARSDEFEYKSPAHKSGSSVSCWMFLQMCRVAADVSGCYFF